MQWVMSLANNPNVTATSDAPQATLALGNHKWTIDGDKGCQKAPTEKILSFSTCTKDEFICSNGLCIDSEARCDSKSDCSDESDEMDCKRVKFSSSYQKYLAPNPSGDNQKLAVEVSEDLITLLVVNEVDSIFHVKYKLHFVWNDSRLTYLNLNNDTHFNALSPQEKQNIWTPDLEFDNTEHNPGTIVDSDTLIAVRKEGPSSQPPETEYENSQNYDGSQNPLTLSRFYNTRFLCNYDMEMFPFDIQKCDLTFTMKGTSGDFVQLQPHKLQYFGARIIKQYICLLYTSDAADE